MSLVLIEGMLGISVDASAQSSSVLDFSAVVPKPRKRVPRPFPPGTMLSGRCGGIIADPPLRISVISLDREHYTIGDNVAYELRLWNSGSAPITIPKVPNLADLEPDDPSTSFKWAPMEIWLLLRDPANCTLATLLITLYGSIDMPWTQLELRPGEWVALLGKAKLEATDPKKRRFYADGFYADNVYSTSEVPRDGVTAMVGYWRGDSLYFEGSTQFEYYGCSNYETSWSPYSWKLSVTAPETHQPISPNPTEGHNPG